MKICYCGNLMKPEGKFYVCTCGKQEPIEKKFILETKTKPNPEIRIAHSEIHPLAAFDHVCSECGYEKAQVVSKGVQYGDEDEELEFICGKCGHHDAADGLKPT